MKKEESWMATYTGKMFYPFNPDVHQIDPVDIAHALSHLCRYGGHSNIFYSVAQHSLNTSYILEELGHSPLMQLYALLHDASEAYIMDLPRPFKVFLSEYNEIEDKVQSVIWKRFGLPKPTEDDYKMIKAADNEMLYWEGGKFTSNINGWADEFKSIKGFELDEIFLEEEKTKDVKEEFLNRLNELLAEYHTWNSLWVRQENEQLKQNVDELISDIDNLVNQLNNKESV